MVPHPTHRPANAQRPPAHRPVLYRSRMAPTSEGGLRVPPRGRAHAIGINRSCSHGGSSPASEFYLAPKNRSVITHFLSFMLTPSLPWGRLTAGRFWTEPPGTFEARSWEGRSSMAKSAANSIHDRPGLAWLGNVPRDAFADRRCVSARFPRKLSKPPTRPHPRRMGRTHGGARPMAACPAARGTQAGLGPALQRARDLILGGTR